MQQETGCPCQNQSLCQPVLKRNKWEVVGYTTAATPQTYKNFNWDRLTTVVFTARAKSAFICFAHSKGVKVHQMVVPSRTDLITEVAR